MAVTGTTACGRGGARTAEGALGAGAGGLDAEGATVRADATQLAEDAKSGEEQEWRQQPRQQEWPACSKPPPPLYHKSTDQRQGPAGVERSGAGGTDAGTMFKTEGKPRRSPHVIARPPSRPPDHHRAMSHVPLWAKRDRDRDGDHLPSVMLHALPIAKKVVSIL